MSCCFLFLLLSYFFFYCSGDHRDLHSFPTRRSSDLVPCLERRAILRAVMEQSPTPHVRFSEHFEGDGATLLDRKSTRLNSSHRCISYAVFCLKKKKKKCKKR